MPVEIEGNLDNKKKQELFYLEKVLELKRIVPSKIVLCDPPDFKIMVNNKTIGVEVTEYYKDISKKGSISREIEEYEDYIEDELNNVVSKLDYLKGVDALFEYKKNDSRPARNEIRSFIKEFVALVSQVKDDEWTDSKEIKPTSEFPILNKYIAWLIVYKNLSYPCWRQYKGGHITLTEDILIKVIEPKLLKAEKYKINSDVEDLWLIIGAGHLSSQATPPPNFVEMYLKKFDKIEEMIKNSTFNRVYFYLSFEYTAFEWPRWKKIAL